MRANLEGCVLADRAAPPAGGEQRDLSVEVSGSGFPPGRAGTGRRTDDRPSGGEPASARGPPPSACRTPRAQRRPTAGVDRARRRERAGTALPAQGRRDLRVARAPGRGRRLQRAHRDARPSSWAGGPPFSRWATCLLRAEALAVLQRPGLPLQARAPAGGGREGGGRALGRDRQQGRPWEDLAGCAGSRTFRSS